MHCHITSFERVARDDFCIHRRFPLAWKQRCEAHRGTRTIAAPYLAPAHALMRQRQLQRETLLHSREGRPSFYPTRAVQHSRVLALYCLEGQLRFASRVRINAEILDVSRRNKAIPE